MNSLVLRKSCACLLLLCAMRPAVCAEATPPGEDEFLRAQILGEEGNLKTALSLYTRVLREAPEPDLRQAAREELHALGLDEREIIKLDPDKTPAEELDALIKRIAAHQAYLRRLHLDREYAAALIRDGLEVRYDKDGKVLASLNAKDAAKALEMLFALALDPKGAEVAGEAREFLELTGITGARIEVVRALAAKGSLDEEAEKELIAAALLQRLRAYHDWREGDEFDETQLLKRKLAPSLALPVWRVLQETYAQTRCVRQNQELLAYWKKTAEATPAKSSAPVEAGKSGPADAESNTVPKF